MRVAIAGGGIVGFAIGWTLLRQGCEVHLFDRGEMPSAASVAAAGLLCPYSEVRGEDAALVALGEQSLALYPQFLAELSEDAGCRLEWESKGALYACVDGDDAAEMEHRFSRRPFPVRYLSLKEARGIEPLLSPRLQGAFWLEGEAQVDTRLAMEALRRAVLFRGGVLREGKEVRRVVEENGCARGVELEGGERFDCDLVILARGAFAEGIRPRKGQILTLRMPERLRLSAIVRTPRVYLAPKRSGLVRIGATDEDAGFDTSVTAGACLELLQAAFEAVPAIAEMGFEEFLAALRPVSKNRLPVIGKTAVAGLFRAEGHGRAGWLLAPYTAKIIQEEINLCRLSSTERP